MSRQLDLRTGRPVWTAYRAPRVPVARLTRDIRAGVLVVGMGISGAMVAEALSAAGHAVVMIDRRGAVLGSTAATTALVQFEIDQPLVRLAAAIGDDAAEAAWRRSRLAVFNLKARIAELGLRCDLGLRRSLYLTGDVLGPAELREEAARRRAAGIHASYLTRGALKAEYGLDRDGAVVSHDNLVLDPRKLTAGLLRAAQERGARLYAPAEATGFVHTGDGVEVATEGGPVISAGHVVLATGYELASIVPAEGHEVISNLGDRDEAAEAQSLAPRGADLGGVGPVSLSEGDRRRAGRLRRGGRGVQRRGGAGRVDRGQDGSDRAQAEAADAGARHHAGVRLGGGVRRYCDGIADHPAAAAPAADPRRHGLRGQRDHLFADRIRDHRDGTGRWAGSRCRSVRGPRRVI